MMTGIYIHVPFCAKRCPYCDFAFVVRKQPPIDRFVAALQAELSLAAPAPADSVYFGGGTPSLLPAPALAALLAAIPRHTAAPVALEANPEDRARLAGYADLGISRLSLGVQSLDDRHLATLGRGHDADAAADAVAEAVRRFGDVSADLIFGVPGMSTADLLRDAQRLIDLGVGHISAYGLTVHEGTLLAKAVRDERFQTVAEGAEREQFLALDAYLTTRGFEHYEISNYALPGRRSRHNELYWTGGAYRGLGPSAHSYDPVGARRFWNLRSFDRWAAALEAGKLPVEGEEILDENALRTERLYLALRRREGIPVTEISPDAAVQSRLARAAADNLVRLAGGHVALTPEGMAVADTVVEALLG